MHCPICRNKEGHKMDCENAGYVAGLEAKLEKLEAAAKRVMVLLDDAPFYHDERTSRLYKYAAWQKEACAVSKLLEGGEL